MKIVYTTDLHGDKGKYERLFSVAKSIKAKIVVNGGDMLPKGYDLFRQGKFITNYLDKYFSRFESAGIYYLGFLGNDDLRIFDELFEITCDKYSYIVPLAQHKFDLGEHEFIGMNLVVDYPFRLKDRCRKDSCEYIFQEQFGKGLLSTSNGWQVIDDWYTFANTLPTIEDEFKQLVRPKNMVNCIYVIHMPPSKLGLDKCGNGLEVGSDAVYDFLLKNQPMISLHGHIHESPEVTGQWYSKIGRTLCIQPGQLNEFTYVTIDLATMKYERITE